MLKKRTSIIIAILLLSCILMPTTIINATSGSAVTYFSGVKKGKVSIGNKWGSGIIGNCVKSFSSKSHNDLAITSLALSAATENNKQCAEDLLKTCFKFENKHVLSFDYDKAWLDSFKANEPACTMAYKKEKINNKTSNIFVVAIRGTTDLGDIETDIYSFISNNGFQDAANSVESNLETFMKAQTGKSIKKIKKDNNIFIITGHSLGGAVANLVARDVKYNGFAKEKNTLGYTFAAPKTTNNPSSTCLNIHNYVHNDDIVPTLSNKSNWHGSVNSFTCSNYAPEIYENFQTINGKDYQSSINSIDVKKSLDYKHSCDIYMSYLMTQCTKDKETEAGEYMEKVINALRDDDLDTAEYYNSFLPKTASEKCVKNMSKAMKKAYKKKVQYWAKKKCSWDKSRFVFIDYYLTDFDNDGKAELIVKEGPDYAGTLCHLYKYKNGKIKTLSNLLCGEENLHAYQGHNGILADGAHTGGWWAELLTIKNNKTNRISICGIDGFESSYDLPQIRNELKSHSKYVSLSKYRGKHKPLYGDLN